MRLSHFENTKTTFRFSPSRPVSAILIAMISTLRALLFSVLLPATLTAAVETWTISSGSIQAECLGVKGAYVVFKKADGSRMLVPFNKLTPADQARASGVDFKAPATKVLIKPTSESETPAMTKIAAALRGKLVDLNGRALHATDPAKMSDTQVYAVYFSASWCGPCRRFTPQLVAAYPKIKAAHPEFEVIFVSNDEDEDSMKHYMIDDHMPWVALRFADVATNSTLLRYQQPGIPNLVFIDGDGRILSKSFNDRGEYDGPNKVLDDIRRYFKM